MSSTYLTQTQSDGPDANGNASVQLAPAANQYWAVSTVRVSQTVQPQFQTPATVNLFQNQITSQALNYPYCALYAGPTNDLSATAFIDDTVLGSGDISSALSGTIISYGNAITAVWKNATIGANCILTIYGRSSDNLVELQQDLAPVPGARFSGTTANAAVWTAGKVINTTGGNLSGGGWSFTTATNSANTELVSVHFTATTSAVVGNRQIGVRIQDPAGNDLSRTFAPGIQGASGNNVRYTFAQGITAISGGSLGFQNGCLPQRMGIPPGSTISSVGINLDAADTWDNLAITYRQYLSYTNVSFT